MAVGDQALPLPRPTDRKTSTSTTLTLTAADLASEARVDIARAKRVLPVVASIIEEYAPRAPIAIKTEAAIRFGGYLLSARPGNMTSKSAGPISADYQTNHAAAFRNCGAAALLTRWKVRRAGSIG